MLPRICIALALALTTISAQAQTQDPAAICKAASEAALQEYSGKGLKADQIAISLALIDRKTNTLTRGDYQGEQGFYPASVVKLFYIVYVAQQLHDGKLTMTPEFERGCHDMIVDSVNDATALVVDTITGTTGGPELPPAEFKAWQHKRNVVCRFYAARGFKNINCDQKTWNEGPYGRERQSYGVNFENRNKLTANACVTLMSDIATDKAIRGPSDSDKNWSEWMKTFLSRTIPADDPNTNYQAKAFTGKILPKGSKLWSKAGWTDNFRHDVAWVKLPDGKEFVLAVFTKDNSSNEDLIPFIGNYVVQAVEKE